MHNAAPGRPFFNKKFGAKPLFSETAKAFCTHAISSLSSKSATAAAIAQGERFKSNAVDEDCVGKAVSAAGAAG